MKKFFKKPFRWAIIFSLILISTFVYALLDTFVIPKNLTAVASINSNSNTSTENDTIASESETEAVITSQSFKDDNIQITIETIRENGTTVYIADVQLTDATHLKTALANETYGKNIKDKTSVIAEENNAIFAINGDYYGFRNSGYVLRNGVLYRNTAEDTEALVIDDDGNFSIIDETETSINSLDIDSIWQILSFGPALINNGKIVVDSSDEVSQSMLSNPRTAIGQISELHYIFVVSDGRTSESSGLSLLELANIMYDKGCTVAYNLDGGGSSTMYFNGEVINNPTDGSSIKERAVSDIVYIGY